MPTDAVEFFRINKGFMWQAKSCADGEFNKRRAEFALFAADGKIQRGDLANMDRKQRNTHLLVRTNNRSYSGANNKSRGWCYGREWATATRWEKRGETRARLSEVEKRRQITRGSRRKTRSSAKLGRKMFTTNAS